jgi:5-methylcytosine-specific restriction endonuclease McrA
MNAELESMLKEVVVAYSMGSAKGVRRARMELGTALRDGTSQKPICTEAARAPDACLFAVSTCRCLGESSLRNAVRVRPCVEGTGSMTRGRCDDRREQRNWVKGGYLAQNCPSVRPSVGSSHLSRFIPAVKGRSTFS